MKLSENIEIEQGDCLQLMKSLGDKSVDMIFADLPYQKTNCPWDTIIPFGPLWEEYTRIIKDRAAICLTAAEPFASLLVTSNLKMFKYDIIWNKKHAKGHLNCNKMPLRIHEHVLVFYKKTPIYSPRMRKGKFRMKGGNNASPGDRVYGKSNSHKSWNDVYYPTSIVEVSGARQIGKIHPTQKPVELMEWFIETYTSPGDTVLDNVMGSGSTGVACVNTGRKFIGFELDINYFEIAKGRLWLTSERQTTTGGNSETN